MHLARSSTRPACHPTLAQVLLLDVDVLVLRPHALLRLFAPLGDYDLAGVMEGISRDLEGSLEGSSRDWNATGGHGAGGSAGGGGGAGGGAGGTPGAGNPARSDVLPPDVVERGWEVSRYRAATARIQAAAPCTPGCSPMHSRLQPHALQAAAPCTPCCSPMHPTGEHGPARRAAPGRAPRACVGC